MKYKYKARFVPSGTSINSTDDIKIVEFTSNNHIHKNSDIKEAKVELQKDMDAYVARNYWDIYDFLIGYSKEPWDSVSDLRKKIKHFIGPSSQTKTGTKDVHFVSIDHHSGCTETEIAEFIRSEYNIKIVDKVQIEPVASTNTRFYYVWQSKV